MRETSVFLVTFAAALFLELTFAIFAGVLLSLVLYLERTSRPRIVTRTPDPNLPGRAFSSDPELTQCPQLRFLRIDGSLFFGSVPHVQDVFDRQRAEHPEQKHLALIASGINFVDLQGAEALTDEAQQRRAAGGDMYLIKVKQRVWDMLGQCGCMHERDERNVFQSEEVAIRAIYQKLDKSVCATCEARIFGECSR
jgi:SulP family sulfate permease